MVQENRLQEIDTLNANTPSHCFSLSFLLSFIERTQLLNAKKLIRVKNTLIALMHKNSRFCFRFSDRFFTQYPFILQTSIAHEHLPEPVRVPGLTFHIAQFFKFLVLLVGILTSLLSRLFLKSLCIFKTCAV